MSHEQINIAIAESCGLHVCPGCFHQIDPDCCCCGDRITHYPDEHHPIPMGCTCGYDDAEKRKAPQPCCPNYTASLDACAEFEAKLTKDREMEEYIWYLNRAHPTADIHCPYEYGRRFAQELRREVFGIATSKPIQRCEAYLRTIGKWTTSTQQPT